MKDKRHDTRLLPVEKPTKRTWLWEELEGKQIARLEYLGVMPDGGEALGFEMTNMERFIFWPIQDRNPESLYRWRILIRKITAQKIVTKRMAKHFGDERKNELGGPVKQDDLQELIEGEVIRGIPRPPGPSQFGGESINIEFKSGFRLHIEAAPPKPGGPVRADLLVVPDFPRSRTTVLPAVPLVH